MQKKIFIFNNKMLFNMFFMLNKYKIKFKMYVLELQKRNKKLNQKIIKKIKIQIKCIKNKKKKYQYNNKCNLFQIGLYIEKINQHLLVQLILSYLINFNKVIIYHNIIRFIKCLK